MKFYFKERINNYLINIKKQSKNISERSIIHDKQESKSK